MCIKGRFPKALNRALRRMGYAPPLPRAAESLKQKRHSIFPAERYVGAMKRDSFVFLIPRPIHNLHHPAAECAGWDPPQVVKLLRPG